VLNSQGSATIAEGKGAAFVTAKGMGRLTLSLAPFAAAAQAEAFWGRLTLTWNGDRYMLLSSTPICGGEQPHAVWAALDPNDVQEGVGSAPVH